MEIDRTGCADELGVGIDAADVAATAVTSGRTVRRHVVVERGERAGEVRDIRDRQDILDGVTGGGIDEDPGTVPVVDRDVLNDSIVTLEMD